MPTEILLDILSITLNDSKQNYFERLHTVRQVCTLWADLLSAPTFWGVADSSYILPVVKEALVRSKNAWLDVRLGSFEAGKQVDEEAFLGHVWRWRSIVFYGELSHNILDMLDSLAAPNLKDISFVNPVEEVEWNLAGGKLNSSCSPARHAIGLKTLETFCEPLQ